MRARRPRRVTPRHGHHTPPRRGARVLIAAGVVMMALVAVFLFTADETGDSGSGSEPTASLPTSSATARAADEPHTFTFAGFADAFATRLDTHPNGLGDAFTDVFGRATEQASLTGGFRVRDVLVDDLALLVQTTEVADGGGLRRIRIAADPTLLDSNGDPEALYLRFGLLGEAIVWALLPDDAGGTPADVSALLADSFDEPQIMSGVHRVTTAGNGERLVTTIDLDIPPAT